MRPLKEGLLILFLLGLSSPLLFPQFASGSFLPSAVLKCDPAARGENDDIFSLIQDSRQVAPSGKITTAPPQKKLDISGIWESSIGWKYNLKQDGNKFYWTVINRNHTAFGTISQNGKDIEVTWTDNDSKGTSKGTIIEADRQGKVTFIEWDNGVFFHRKS